MLHARSPATRKEVSGKSEGITDMKKQEDDIAMNIIVVGTGMYVCGTGSDGYGTIMPAILEWKKTHDIGTIYVVGRSPKSIRAAKAKIKELSLKMGVQAPVEYLPEDSVNDDGYKRAMREAGKPACVIVAVPDGLHKAVASASIQSGFHTLVVKPLVNTVKDLYDLVKLQDNKGVYCAVEFHKRLDYANRALKDVIEKAAIGDPLYFIAEFSQRKSVPTEHFRKWVNKTNIFQYLGIHYVDVIYFCTKAIPKRVMAIGQKNWIISKGIDTYDSIQGMIEWEMPSKNKFNSYIATNWIDPESTSAMSDQKIKVVGTKGRFESDQKKRGITIMTDDNGIEEPNPYFCAPYGREGEAVYRGYGIESVCQFLNDVIDVNSGKVSIDELERMRPTFRQSLIPVAIIEAVNKSLRAGGRWVDISKICKNVK